MRRREKAPGPVFLSGGNCRGTRCGCLLCRGSRVTRDQLDELRVADLAHHDIADDAAVAQDHRAPGDLPHGAHVVRYEQYRDAVADDTSDEVEEEDLLVLGE